MTNYYVNKPMDVFNSPISPSFNVLDLKENPSKKNSSSLFSSLHACKFKPGLLWWQWWWLGVVQKIALNFFFFRASFAQSFVEGSNGVFRERIGALFIINCTKVFFLPQVAVSKTTNILLKFCCILSFPLLPAFTEGSCLHLIFKAPLFASLPFVFPFF